jgi:hypothetical protein
VGKPSVQTAWRITLDGWRLGWCAGRAMPLLLLTTLAASVLIEAADTYWGKPKGITLASDAGPLLWNTVRALLKGCLAASAEIAVYRFVLLGEVADRPVWRTPPRFRRYIAYGLALGGTLAVLLGLIPYVSFQRTHGLAVMLTLAFGLVVIATVARSVWLFRVIAAEASGRVTDNAWRDIKGHWWRLVRVLIWQMVLAMVLAAAIGMVGPGLTDLGLAGFRGISDHAAAVVQAVAFPYTFAASFSVLYRSLAGQLRVAPAPATNWASWTAPTVRMPSYDAGD